MTPKSKYYPLFEYLKQQPDSGLLELAFAEIEKIIGKSLPSSACTTRAWWANSRAPQAHAWQDADWLVDSVDFAEESVTFRPARISYRVTPVRKSPGWSGEQIKALREFAGWTQQELANQLSVRQQTVSDWELGLHTSHRSTTRLLQIIAEDVGFPYQTDQNK